MHLIDEKEYNFTNVGIIKIENPEKKEINYFNSSIKINCIKLNKKLIKQKEKLYCMSKKYLFDYHYMNNSDDYIKLLLNIFNKKNYLLHSN